MLSFSAPLLQLLGITSPGAKYRKRNKTSVDFYASQKSKQTRTGRPEEQPWRLIQDVLLDRATAEPQRSLLFYPLGSTASSTPVQVSYNQLYTQAKNNSRYLTGLPRFRRGGPVLLHLEDNEDAIVWFWAVLLAGGVPAMSSPMSSIEENRKNHLQHLSTLLESPICITRESSLPLFECGDHDLQLHSLELLLGANTDAGAEVNFEAACDAQSSQPAALMLTSGSTGDAKAVRLEHSQVLAAVTGKMNMRELPDSGTFLNWIGMDHVAALVETHLAALWFGVDQIHVQAADIVARPSLFMELLSRHRVSRTFAPNFFLASLVASHPSPPTEGPSTWDLSNLAALISGGEANDIDTVKSTAALLGRYGAPSSVVQPGFGMTETCAGCIYNVDCPAYDIKSGRKVASLGHCVQGMEMRIVDDAGSQREPGEAGHLEVRGTEVFDGYYRNPKATNKAFPSSNGWFRTGDRAVIDAEGNLNMIGRVKEVFNVNGIKIVAAEIQGALEAALRSTHVKRVVSFPSREPGAASEQITVGCVPGREHLEAAEVANIDSIIVQTCVLASSAQPSVFMVGERSRRLLPTSALGKISPAKMRKLFEDGAFDKDVAYHRDVVLEFRQRRQEQTPSVALTPEEELLREDFAETKELDVESVDADTPIFELGFSSLDLIQLKHRISNRLQITVTIITMMRNPTVRKLAAALHCNRPDTKASSPASDERQESSTEYDPVVVLRPGGTKTPLWLIHPGVGEVLVFVSLAQRMNDDRPIYALRARGFEPGQSNFSYIGEAVDTYTAAIQRNQPQGPYAIAGYSYGAMLAFETAKKLESQGETIGFLGSFNLPPHIKYRMRQLTWNMCLLHLAQFLGLSAEETVNDIIENHTLFSELSRADALRQVMTISDGSRLYELGLSEVGLLQWADVAYGLQSMAADYDPSGHVNVLDVFHAEPLKVAASSRDEWMSHHMSQWRDFCETEPRLHAVEGGHYTMLGTNHIMSFTETLCSALKQRGI